MQGRITVMTNIKNDELVKKVADAILKEVHSAEFNIVADKCPKLFKALNNLMANYTMSSKL